MTENLWRAIILTLSCAVVIITVYCLSAGITIIFMHLYYIPIVLLAYHYRKKGFFLSVLLSLLYFAFVVAYEPSDLDTIEGAGIRAILFIAVAALVVYLSEHLVQARESLGKTTQIQQSILQNANVWLMVLDSRGKILLWNKAAEEISGYNADEVIGKNEVWKLLYPERDYRKEITDKITEIIRKNNYLENLRTTIVCKNGTHKIILWNTRGLPGEADKSSQFIAIGVDITDRTHAEEELKRSEERYRQFFNTSRDCVFITSPDGCWIDLNDAAVEFFGYGSREELQKVKVSDLYEDPSERDRHLRYINERGYSIEHPVNLWKKDGTIINTLITSVAIKDEKGKIVSYQGTIRDVTERKRMEESLKKSQLQLTEAMDLADLVNWEFDVPTGIFTFNDRFYAMYGTTAEREGGYEMPAEVYAREFVHPDEIIVVADEVNRAITTTDPDYVSQVEHRIIRRDGEIRHIIVRIAITKDADGRTIKTHGANQDITEIKKTEEALRETTGYLQNLFDYANAPIITWDPGFYITRFNHAFEHLTGRSQEEVLGKTLDLLFPDESRKASMALIQKTLEGERWETVEIPILNTDGSTKTVLWNSANVLDPHGKLTATIAQGFDITERKGADAALKVSEHKYRTLVENIPEKIFIKDALLAYVSCNDPYARDLGIAAEAIAGKTDFDFYPRDLAEKYRADDRAVMESGATSTIDERYVLNGVEFWVSTVKTPIRDNAGNISGILGIFHDITEQKRVEGAIRQSEERYRTLAEASPDQIFIVGRDDTIQYVNSTALKLLRLPYDQVIGKPRTDLFPPEIAKSQSASLQMVFETGESIRKEEMIPFGMKELWVDLSLVPLKDEVGNVTSILGIARDITERKRVNEVLRESEVRFRTMADWTSDWEYWIDLNRKFIYLSPSVERITGYRPEEFMADPYLIDRIVHPDDRMMWDAHVPLHLTTKEINQSEIEFRLIHKDGSVRWISHICRSIFLDDGTCIGKRVSNRDVTDRKRVEAALQESEILLNEVSEMARVGGWDLDIATKDIRLTRETYHIFESPEGSLVSMSNAILFFDMPDRSRLEAALQQCMEHGEPYDLELPFTSATGRHIWTRAMGRAVKSDGRIVKLTGTFQDITEHKQTEELRRHFAEELEQQVKSRTKDLNASLDEKVILLREVHHRVNNNLQIIISLLNLQSRQITDPGVIAALKESIQRVRTISMVHEKLYQSESLSQIDLADYIRFLSTQIVSYYGIDTRTVTLGIDIEKVMIDVNTAIPLGLILNELISNALRHGFPGGRGGTVSISGRYGDKALTITVKDDGVGLPPGLDWRNTESLGLRLVNSLVDQLDGTIEYRNEHGTMFTITVPTKNAK